MIWLSISTMAAITFLNRYVFFARGLAYQPSAKVKQFLSFSSYAVLTAIWAPIIFKVDSDFSLSHAGWDYLIAGAVAAMLSLLRVPSIVTVVVSSGVFFMLRFTVLAS